MSKTEDGLGPLLGGLFGAMSGVSRAMEIDELSQMAQIGRTLIEMTCSDAIRHSQILMSNDVMAESERRRINVAGWKLIKFVADSVEKRNGETKTVDARK